MGYCLYCCFHLKKTKPPNTTKREGRVPICTVSINDKASNERIHSSAMI